MAGTFHLIDLVTQCHAVERVLAGRSDAEKIAWLSQHGSIFPIIQISRADIILEPSRPTSSDLRLA